MIIQPYKKLIIVSGPVIVKDEKVLLDISSEDDFWKFCGGKVKQEETLIAGAKRRAKEELNIDIEIINDTPFLLYTNKNIGDEKVDIILSHYLAKITSDEIVPGEGVEKYKWIPISELNNYKIAPNIIPALKHFGFIE